MKAFGYLALAALILPGTGDAGNWRIDTGHSSVQFEILHLGVAKSTGRFTDFDGTIAFDPEKPEAASVAVTIQTASVWTGSEKRDGHLKSPDFFDVEVNPVITFASTSVEKTDDGMVATGKLNWNGVENEIAIPFTLVGTGPDAWGNTRAGFSGEAVLSRKAFGEFGPKYTEPTLSDEVTVVMNLEVVLEKEAEAVAN